jgi:hypothetical protein
MTTTSVSSNSASSSVAPAEIGGRILRMLGQIHDRSDLAPARIEALTGLPVAFDPGNANRYGFGTTLDDGWACNLASVPDIGGGPPKRLVFSYDDLHQRPEATVPVSAPEFDGFARELRDAGYAQSIVDGPRGAIWGHRFVRDGVAVDVHTERENPAADPILVRVSRVVVDASAATEVGHG